MHIFFQNNQYLGSYYFTRSENDPVGRQKNNYRPNLFNSKLDLNAGEAILPIDFSFNWENDRLAADKVSVSDIDNV